MQNRNQNRNQNLSAAQLSAMVQEEDLEELKALQKELQDRTYKAHDDGRVYMMAQYTKILATVSSEVHKVGARFNRESLAGMRKMHKDLKLNARGEPSDEEE